MGRRYAVVFEAVAVTAIQDLFEIVAGPNTVVVIHACFISQESDAGDAQDELLRVTWTRGYTTSGSGGTAANATPLDSGDVADEAAIEVNNTVQASVGTPVILHVECFNVRAGWAYIPTPECRITLSPDERLVLELPVAPADALTMSGTLIFEELGGT